MFLSRRMFRFLYTMAALFAVIYLPAQREGIVFEHIGQEEGIGQTFGILQDGYGFIWFGIMSGLIRYDGCNFVQYTHQPNDSTSLSHPSIIAELEDCQGYIWARSSYGLNRWDRKTNHFRRYYSDQGLPGNNITAVFEDQCRTLWVGTDRGLAWYDGKVFHKVMLKKSGSTNKDFYIHTINAIAEDHEGNILVGTSHAGIAVIDRTKKKRDTIIIKDLFPSNIGSPSPVIEKLYKDQNDGIWACTDAGLFFKKKQGEIFEYIPLPGTPREQAVRNIIQDKNGFLWISTLNNNGLFRRSPDGIVEHFKYSASNAFGLSSNYVRELMIDRHNQLWITTYNGLNKVDLNSPNFTFLQQEPGIFRPENQIYKAYLDRQGGLWFSTYDQQGFYAKKLGEKAKKLDFLPFRSKPTQLTNFCQTSEGDVWIATDPNGILRISQGQATWLDELTVQGDSLELLGQFLIEEDNKDSDYIWFSSQNGLCKLHKKTLKRTYFPPKKDITLIRRNAIYKGWQAQNNRIYVLLEDPLNSLLGYFDKDSSHYRLIKIAKALPDRKNTARIRQFTSTPEGIIWMATALGLGKYNPENDSFSILTTTNGLMEENIMGIATDHEGNVWLKTVHYVSKYNPRLHSFWHFRVAKDMKEFNAVGATVGLDGRIIFYGNNGFFAFYPDSVRLDTSLPKVVLTDFKVLNKSRQFGTAPELIQNIKLCHRDNVFSFEFAALHFRDSKNNHFRYRMQGFDKNWIEVGTERKATYTNLSAGHYTFQVEASNADGVWNTLPLSTYIQISPAPWYTWWAYLSYAIITFFIIKGLYLFQLRRRIAENEAERFKELDALKSRLYTNITHEFRTPLTIILGMARQVLDDPKNYFRQGLDMIIRNGQNLLSLVNQMLDLSKLESGKMSLHLEQGDIISFLKYLLESFHSLASNKNIQLHFLSDYDVFVMDYDPERLQQIITNLLSNAIKFTSAGGNVYLDVRRTRDEAHGVLRTSYLELRVRDTGIGISETDLPHIFERFYQADDSHTRKGEGTGIGLALTKELIKLMEGDIQVKSKPGQGSEFIITLPIHQKAPEMAQPVLTSDTTPVNKVNNFSDPGTLVNTAQSTILLIEDNNDVISYLVTCLQDQYQILIGADGQQGIDLALHHIPDLIITDVMMPYKDGFEVCQTLKNDERTSHIPIIMLTAKADMTSKLEGLERGADDYFAKPFHKEELLVRVRKLLELRQQLQRYYLANAGLKEDINSKDIPKIDVIDDAFVKKVRQVVEEHLDDTEFTVEALCKEVIMSHSQLHRKLSALTGFSANIFIRYVRLNKAKELLRNQSLTITAVAFDTGFNDPSYFGRVFKQEFGVTPQEWREAAIIREK